MQDLYEHRLGNLKLELINSSISCSTYVHIIQRDKYLFYVKSLVKLNIIYKTVDIITPAEYQTEINHLLRNIK